MIFRERVHTPVGFRRRPILQLERDHMRQIELSRLFHLFGCQCHDSLDGRLHIFRLQTYGLSHNTVCIGHTHPLPTHGTKYEALKVVRKSCVAWAQIEIIAECQPIQKTFSQNGYGYLLVPCFC